MSSAEIPVERLQELFAYDAATGQVTRRVSRKNTHPVGSIVGREDNRGRPVAAVDGHNCFVSRIAWALFHGSHPVGVIDHINGNCADNRLCNLRDVPPMINSQNRHRPKKGSKTGLLGVRKHARPNLFSASIIFEGHVVYAGRFTTAEAAHDFYLRLKRRLHDGYAG